MNIPNQSTVFLFDCGVHANNGRLVSTPNLRLVSYNGTVIPVSSEWSAFVNPWTKTIEMIVGRHCINHEASEANALSSSSETTATNNNKTSAIIQPEKFRELDSSIHSFISRPIISDEIITPTTIIAEKIIKQELQDEQPVVLQPQPQQQHQNLRNYIDNVVENLVISQEEKQQVEEEIKTLQEATPILSYNQINCLENVHRLLKSQSKFLEFDTKEKENNSNNSSNVETTTTKPSTITLTRELLQQHNRKWESQCKDTWKKRLNMKRIAASGNAEEKQQPPTKTPRIRSEPQAYSISTTPLPPTNRVISSPYQHPSSTPSATTTTTNNFLPPLPYPPPTPLDQQAWTEYVKLVQLHLQNMATIDQQQQQQQSNKRITSLQQYHHHHQQQQQQRVQHERQLAALAMTFQQVQIPPHHHHSHSHQQQPSGASSPFNALPSLN
uniref:Uncharacterized protein n=1 Tax=Panagrolaimus sp. PS1159 TaxID=55785 RepID=A0AC35G0X1_9BILA